MVYVVMQELAKTAEDTIMITSSIMKDTSTSSETIYRPNSIRALCRIIDAGSIPAIERPISTAIVDKTPAVSSAALVSSIHLFPLSKDIVRRWANQVSEVMTSKTVGSSVAIPNSMSHLNIRPNATFMCQYHALGLLYLMRGHDRMGIVKMIQNYSVPPKTGGFFGGSSPNLKSSWAICLLVRYARQMIDDDAQFRAPMMTLLDGWLKHKSDMVNLEAAKAILTLPSVQQSEASNALSALQLFLTSPRYITRFSAIRILNKFSLRFPQMMASMNAEIEPLVSDTNRSIATYAITTLLKTGSEESVERLMKTIQGFMADISDEFKIIVVSSIRALCLKFPAKQELTINFLSQVLRDEGGYEFKKAVVDALFDLIRYVQASKEEALSQLCEFIEDCEYSKLATRILFVLGREGPKAPQPSKYVRYIYNRVILENAIVRASAVNALARFARVPSLRDNITVLLKRCLGDPDDEVRDRAALNLRVIGEDLSAKYVDNESMYALPQLEKALVMYVQEAKYGAAFKIEEIPIITREESDAAALQGKTEITQEEIIAAPKMETAVAVPMPSTAQFAEQLSAIEEFKAYGEILKSGNTIELTTTEMEFYVTAHVHSFKEHLVIQYDIKNTLNDTILENISVVAQPVDDLFVEDFILEGARATHEENATVYVSFSKKEKFGICEFTNTLRYTSKEVDPSTGEIQEEGYDDEYEVDNLELSASIYVAPLYISNFASAFDALGVASQATETYALPDMSGLQEACDKVVAALSMQVLEGSDVPMQQATHTMKLAGKAVTTGSKVLANVQMAWSARSGVTLKISARSEDASVAELVVSAF